MSGESDGAVNGVAREFVRWAAKKEGLDAPQVLAGLGHLGNFLRAVSDAYHDLEMGHESTEQTELLLEEQPSNDTSLELEERFSKEECKLLKEFHFLKPPGIFPLPLLI